MRIGLVGSGKVGGTLAGVLVRAGHEVALSNPRGPETLADQVAEVGPDEATALIAQAKRNR